MTCFFLKVPSYLVGKLIVPKVMISLAHILISCLIMYSCTYLILWLILLYLCSFLLFIFCSTTDKEDQVNCQCTWDVVKGKITKSLLAIKNGVVVQENIVELELDRAKRPLSLYAVANGPRFRLLLSSIEQLENEVGTYSLCPYSLFPPCLFGSQHLKVIT